MMSEKNDPGQEQNLPLLKVIGSVIAAAFGVQSGKNAARDFTHGKLGIFVAVGIVFVIVTVTTIAMLASSVVKNAQ